MVRHATQDNDPIGWPLWLFASFLSFSSLCLSLCLSLPSFYISHFPPVSFLSFSLSLFLSFSLSLFLSFSLQIVFVLCFKEGLQLFNRMLSLHPRLCLQKPGPKSGSSSNQPTGPATLSHCAKGFFNYQQFVYTQVSWALSNSFSISYFLIEMFCLRF